MDVGEAIQVVLDLAQQFGRSQVDLSDPDDNLKWTKLILISLNSRGEIRQA